MRYDLQIIAPCIEERLDCFQKFGFRNVKDRKVLFYCLVNNKRNFEKNWPDNITVEVVEFKECQEKDFCKNNECYKLYKFLHEFTKTQVEDAKWTMKIDDDCYNDIDGICNFLEKEFDFDRDYYIVAEPRPEMDLPEVEILKKLNLWEAINERWEHEIECSIISREAMRKIYNNSNSMSLFEEKYKYSLYSNRGYTDQCLALAAKLCKIYPVVTSSIVTHGQENQLPLLFLNQEIRYKNKKNYPKNKFFCHFHPLKQDFYQKLLCIENKIKKLNIDEVKMEKFVENPSDPSFLSSKKFLY